MMYILYTNAMRNKPPPSDAPPDTLSLKLGSWFEAHATGWGVIAVPIVVLVLAVAAGVRILLGA